MIYVELRDEVYSNTLQRIIPVASRSVGCKDLKQS